MAVSGDLLAYLGTGAQQAPEGEGLRIKISPIAGITEKGVMSANGFYFQCPPLEEFSVEHAHSHTDYEPVRGGQMSRKGAVQLIAVSFDTLVVDWGTYSLIDVVIAEDFTEQLQDVIDSGTPFLLTVAHQMPTGSFRDWSATMVGPELQMPATLRTMRVTEKAGEGDARYYNLSFTEYRDPVVDRRKLGQTRATDVKLPVTGWLTRPDGFFHYRVPHTKTTKTVRGRLRTEHDAIPYAVTLADLASHFYGNPELAKHIARANNLAWGSHSNLIDADKFRGQKKPKVKIPKRPTDKGPVATGGHVQR